MDNKEKQFWIIIVLMFILIILLVYIALTLPEKSATCLQHPMEYYEYVNNVSCWCTNMSTTFSS